MLAAETPRAADPPAARPARVVAIGDIHGGFDSFVAVLRRAGLVDDRLKWTGDATALVQTGDFTDRGAKIREVMDLLIGLQRQAADAGGKVIVLLGNHEVMNLMRDARDVAPAAYGAFTDAQSGERQARAYREYVEFVRERAAAGVKLPVRSREEWLQSHPAGFVEYAEAFGADGYYGRWLRSLPVVATLGDVAFLHAGINPEKPPRSLDHVNARIRSELRRFDELREYLIRRRLILPSFTLQEILDAAVAELRARQAAWAPGTGGALPADSGFDRRDAEVLAGVLQIGTWDSLRPDGPLWFRGFATWSSDEGRSHLRKLSERFNVQHWVVGHTTTRSMRVTSRFDSGVFLIDTGMLSSHYRGGRASALEIRDRRFSVISLDEEMAVAEEVVH